MCWIRWSASRWSPPTESAAGPDTGCWKRSASSPRTNTPSSSGEPRPARSGEIRDRHARYFATQAVAHWEIWDGPQQRDATDWVEAEFDNLRAGFRWAIDRDDLATATAIAAHTTMIAFDLQRFEPVGWAEELLPAATAAELAQLPRLYTAASFCAFTGRPADAVRYAEAASALQTDPALPTLRHRMGQLTGGSRPSLRRASRPVPGDLHRSDRRDPGSLTSSVCAD